MNRDVRVIHATGPRRPHEVTATRASRLLTISQAGIVASVSRVMVGERARTSQARGSRRGAWPGAPPRADRRRST
jgi:DNA invertase Pin-like site-specific DNA recombinase